VRSSRVLGLGAAVLAAAALTNHALARRAERRNPPEGKFITVDRVRLHYIERGTGPVIVLLHGNGTMAGDFALSGVLDLLAKDHWVIAFDRLGFGFSERPRGRIWTAAAQAALLHEALLGLDVRQPVVVGHSWGTLVALALALRDAADVAGLVVLSGYYFPTVRADAALQSWPAVPVLGDILRYTISPLLARLMAPVVYRKMFAPSPVAPRFAGELPLELAVRPSQIRASAAESALMIPGAADLAEHYSELSIPIAIVAGIGDRIVDCESQAGRLRAELPQSKLRKISDAGHMIHHIVPEEVAAVILDVARMAFAGRPPQSSG
jgi:pimeloyl-ACP methyl ester carboxylesterase